MSGRTLLLRIAVPAVVVVLSSCAGAGVPPQASTASFDVAPAANTTSGDPTTIPAGPTTEAPAPSTSVTATTASDGANTTTTTSGTDSSTTSTTSGEGETTTSTTSTSTTSTTSTIAPPATAPIPGSTTVERLTWSGTMELSAEQEDGSVGTTSGVVTGAYVAPDRHRTEYVEESRLADADGDVIGDRTMEWVVGVVDDRAWFEQDGDVEEMELDQALRFVPYLSSATAGGVVPSDEILADLAGRPASTVSFIGRQGRQIAIADADVELYAPLFLRYSPTLYGTSSSGTRADVELVVDVSTGTLLRAALTMSGSTSAGGDFEIEVAFEASAVDERWIQVLIPG